MTWERLKELMEHQYYPSDIQRTKEREFLSLKKGNLSVMEYAFRFNELSQFTPHQVSTEESRMDHFEQGLRGNIKSMIAGRTFENFQDMYQRAARIAHVLEESENESQALNITKWKKDFHKQGF